MKTSYKALTVLALFLTSTIVGAQHREIALSTAHLNEALRYELLMMRDDVKGLQKSKFIIERKYGPQSAQYEKLSTEIQELDKQHSVRVGEITSAYGWPGYSLVGKDGANALWLITQRLDKDILKACAPLIIKAARAGEANKFQAAVLQDKALILNGKKQWFGTQLYINAETGKVEVFPVADEANLENRRLEMNLGPISEYLTKYQTAYSQQIEEAAPQQAAEIEAHAE
jgi:hypothetical protein